MRPAERRAGASSPGAPVLSGTGPRDDGVSPSKAATAAALMRVDDCMERFERLTTDRTEPALNFVEKSKAGSWGGVQQVVTARDIYGRR